MAGNDLFQSATMLFLRHGQQEANESGVVGSLSQLSEKGRLQAELLAAELSSGIALGAVYSSPLPRAVATAEAICGRLSLIPILEPRLTEFELGERQIDEIAD